VHASAPDDDASAKAVVAAIHGYALGGGLEISLKGGDREAASVDHHHRLDRQVGINSFRHLNDALGHASAQRVTDGSSK
jgi:hypothetical protein